MLKSTCKEKWYEKYTWLSLLPSFVFHNKFIMKWMCAIKVDEFAVFFEVFIIQED